MNTILIKLFNAAIPEKSTTSFAAVNAEAIQRGYIVEPDACTDSVLKFLREQDINPNATFYKTWEDVLSKTRFELLVDQIFHYMTTYGTGFAIDNGYVPNDGEIDIQTTFKTYKVIKAITAEELCKRCYNMLASGIALKEETMKACADYVIATAGKSVDVDGIKNKEALIYICEKLGVYPNDKFNLFRYIMYVTTGQTLVIKNKSMIDTIKRSATPFDFSKLNKRQMEALASIFLRYKDLFLAFKHSIKQSAVKQSYYYRTCTTDIKAVPSKNAPYINKLRKMAIKLHEPMKAGFWQTVFSTEHTLDELNAHMDELTAYKKVALMQSCLERATGIENQVYVIRNQKVFMREGYKPSADTAYVAKVYAALYTSLIETLHNNSRKVVEVKTDENGEKTVIMAAKTVRVIDGVSVALPTSEKSFIGNYPFGTTYMLSDNNYFGIYWRNEWGTRDYDLSFLDVNGSRIGWNASYYTDEKTVVFSGDMTNAEPEAAEVLWMKNAGTKGIVKVNQFCGNDKSKYQFFFGQSKNGIRLNKYDRSGGNVGYMVDPASIKLKVEIEHESQREQQIAVVDTDRVVLMSVNTGNGRVSYGNRKYTEMMQETIMHKAKCFVQSEDLLRVAGFEVVDASYEGDVDIDFNNLDKDSLIALMQ